MANSLSEDAQSVIEILVKPKIEEGQITEKASELGTKINEKINEKINVGYGDQKGYSQTSNELFNDFNSLTKGIYEEFQIDTFVKRLQQIPAVFGRSIDAVVGTAITSMKDFITQTDGILKGTTAKNFENIASRGRLDLAIADASLGRAMQMKKTIDDYIEIRNLISKEKRSAFDSDFAKTVGFATDSRRYQTYSETGTRTLTDKEIFEGLKRGRYGKFISDSLSSGYGLDQKTIDKIMSIANVLSATNQYGSSDFWSTLKTKGKGTFIRTDPTSSALGTVNFYRKGKGKDVDLVGDFVKSQSSLTYRDIVPEGFKYDFKQIPGLAQAVKEAESTRGQETALARQYEFLKQRKITPKMQKEIFKAINGGEDTNPLLIKAIQNAGFGYFTKEGFITPSEFTALQLAAIGGQLHSLLGKDGYSSLEMYGDKLSSDLPQNQNTIARKKNKMIVHGLRAENLISRAIGRDKGTILLTTSKELEDRWDEKIDANNIPEANINRSVSMPVDPHSYQTMTVTFSDAQRGVFPDRKEYRAGTVEGATSGQSGFYSQQQSVLTDVLGIGENKSTQGKLLRYDLYRDYYEMDSKGNVISEGPDRKLKKNQKAYNFVAAGLDRKGKLEVIKTKDGKEMPIKTIDDRLKRDQTGEEYSTVEGPNGSKTVPIVVSNNRELYAVPEEEYQRIMQLSSDFLGFKNEEGKKRIANPLRDLTSPEKLYESTKDVSRTEDSAKKMLTDAVSAESLGWHLPKLSETAVVDLNVLNKYVSKEFQKKHPLGQKSASGVWDYTEYDGSSYFLPEDKKGNTSLPESFVARMFGIKGIGVREDYVKELKEIFGLKDGQQFLFPNITSDNIEGFAEAFANGTINAGNYKNFTGIIGKTKFEGKDLSPYLTDIMSSRAILDSSWFKSSYYTKVNPDLPGKEGENLTQEGIAERIASVVNFVRAARSGAKSRKQYIENSGEILSPEDVRLSDWLYVSATSSQRSSEQESLSQIIGNAAFLTPDDPFYEENRRLWDQKIAKYRNPTTARDLLFDKERNPEYWINPASMALSGEFRSRVANAIQKAEFDKLSGRLYGEGDIAYVTAAAPMLTALMSASEANGINIDSLSDEQKEMLAALTFSGQFVDQFAYQPFGDDKADAVFRYPNNIGEFYELTQNKKFLELVEKFGYDPNMAYMRFKTIRKMGGGDFDADQVQIARRQLSTVLGSALKRLKNGATKNQWERAQTKIDPEQQNVKKFDKPRMMTGEDSADYGYRTLPTTFAIAGSYNAANNIFSNSYNLMKKWGEEETLEIQGALDGAATYNMNTAAQKNDSQFILTKAEQDNLRMGKGFYSLLAELGPQLTETENIMDPEILKSEDVKKLDIRQYAFPSRGHLQTASALAAIGADQSILDKNIFKDFRVLQEYFQKKDFEGLKDLNGNIGLKSDDPLSQYYDFINTYFYNALTQGIDDVRMTPEQMQTFTSLYNQVAERADQLKVGLKQKKASYLVSQHLSKKELDAYFSKQQEYVDTYARAQRQVAMQYASQKARGFFRSYEEGQQPGYDTKKVTGYTKTEQDRQASAYGNEKNFLPWVWSLTSSADPALLAKIYADNEMELINPFKEINGPERIKKMKLSHSALQEATRIPGEKNYTGLKGWNNAVDFYMRATEERWEHPRDTSDNSTFAGHVQNAIFDTAVARKMVRDQELFEGKTPTTEYLTPEEAQEIYNILYKNVSLSKNDYNKLAEMLPEQYRDSWVRSLFGEFREDKSGKHNYQHTYPGTQEDLEKYKGIIDDNGNSVFNQNKQEAASVARFVSEATDKRFTGIEFSINGMDLGVTTEKGDHLTTGRPDFAYLQMETKDGKEQVAYGVTGDNKPQNSLSHLAQITVYDKNSELASASDDTVVLDMPEDKKHIMPYMTYRVKNGNAGEIGYYDSDGNYHNGYYSSGVQTFAYREKGREGEFVPGEVFDRESVQYKQYEDEDKKLGGLIRKTFEAENGAWVNKEGSAPMLFALTQGFNWGKISSFLKKNNMDGVEDFISAYNNGQLSKDVKEQMDIARLDLLVKKGLTPEQISNITIDTTLNTPERSYSTPNNDGQSTKENNNNSNNNNRNNNNNGNSNGGGNGNNGGGNGSGDIWRDENETNPKLANPLSDPNNLSKRIAYEEDLTAEINKEAGRSAGRTAKIRELNRKRMAENAAAGTATTTSNNDKDDIYGSREADILEAEKKALSRFDHTTANEEQLFKIRQQYTDEMTENRYDQVLTMLQTSKSLEKGIRDISTFGNTDNSFVNFVKRYQSLLGARRFINTQEGYLEQAASVVESNVVNGAREGAKNANAIFETEEDSLNKVLLNEIETEKASAISQIDPDKLTDEQRSLLRNSAYTQAANKKFEDIMNIEKELRQAASFTKDGGTPAITMKQYEELMQAYTGLDDSFLTRNGSLIQDENELNALFVKARRKMIQKIQEKTEKEEKNKLMRASGRYLSPEVRAQFAAKNNFDDALDQIKTINGSSLDEQTKNKLTAGIKSKYGMSDYSGLNETQTEKQIEQDRAAYIKEQTEKDKTELRAQDRELMNRTRSRMNAGLLSRYKAQAQNEMDAQLKDLEKMKERENILRKDGNIADADKMKKRIEETSSFINSFTKKDKNKQSTGELNIFGSIRGTSKALLGRFSYMAIRKIFSTVVKTIKDAIKATEEYDKMMSDLQMEIPNLSEDGAESTIKNIKNISDNLGVKIQEVFSLYMDMIKSGIEKNIADINIDQVVKTAKTTGMNGKDISKIISAYLNSIFDSKDVLDAINSMGAFAADKSSDIASAFSMMKTINTNLISAKDLTSIFAIISNGGVSGENGGKEINDILDRLRRVSSGERIKNQNNTFTDLSSVQSALSKVGVSLYDASGSIKNIFSIFQELGKNWENISEQDRNTLSEIVTGNKSSNFNTIISSFAMTDQNGNYLSDIYSEKAQNSDDSINSEYSQYMDSIEAKINSMKESWSEFISNLVPIGLIEGITSFLDSVSERLSNLDAPLKVILGTLVAIGAVIAGITVAKIIGANAHKGIAALALGAGTLAAITAGVVGFVGISALGKKDRIELSNDSGEKKFKNSSQIVDENIEKISSRYKDRKLLIESFTISDPSKLEQNTDSFNQMSYSAQASLQGLCNELRATNDITSKLHGTTKEYNEALVDLQKLNEEKYKRDILEQIKSVENEEAIKASIINSSINSKFYNKKDADKFLSGYNLFDTLFYGNTETSTDFLSTTKLKGTNYKFTGSEFVDSKDAQRMVLNAYIKNGRLDNTGIPSKLESAMNDYYDEVSLEKNLINLSNSNTFELVFTLSDAFRAYKELNGLSNLIDYTDEDEDWMTNVIAQTLNSFELQGILESENEKWIAYVEDNNLDINTSNGFDLLSVYDKVVKGGDDQWFDDLKEKNQEIFGPSFIKFTTERPLELINGIIKDIFNYKINTDKNFKWTTYDDFLKDLTGNISSKETQKAINVVNETFGSNKFWMDIQKQQIDMAYSALDSEVLSKQRTNMRNAGFTETEINAADKLIIDKLRNYENFSALPNGKLLQEGAKYFTDLTPENQTKLIKSIMMNTMTPILTGDIYSKYGENSLYNSSNNYGKNLGFKYMIENADENGNDYYFENTKFALDYRNEYIRRKMNEVKYKEDEIGQTLYYDQNKKGYYYKTKSGKTITAAEYATDINSVNLDLPKIMFGAEEIPAIDETNRTFYAASMAYDNIYGQGSGYKKRASDLSRLLKTINKTEITTPEKLDNFLTQNNINDEITQAIFSETGVAKAALEYNSNRTDYNLDNIITAIENLSGSPLSQIKLQNTIKNNEDYLNAYNSLIGFYGYGNINKTDKDLYTWFDSLEDNIQSQLLSNNPLLATYIERFGTEEKRKGNEAEANAMWSQIMGDLPTNELVQAIQAEQTFGKNTQDVISIIQQLSGTASQSAQAITSMVQALNNAAQVNLTFANWNSGSRTSSTIQGIASITGLNEAQITSGNFDSYIDYQQTLQNNAAKETMQNYMNAMYTNYKDDYVFNKDTKELIWKTKEGKDLYNKMISQAKEMGLEYNIDAETGMPTVTGIDYSKFTQVNPLKEYGTHTSRNTLTSLAQQIMSGGSVEDKDLMTIKGLTKNGKLDYDKLNEIKEKYPELYDYLNMNEDERNEKLGQALEWKINLSFAVDGLEELAEAGMILEETSGWIKDLSKRDSFELSFLKSSRGKINEYRELAAALNVVGDERTYEQAQRIMNATGATEAEYFSNMDLYESEVNEYLKASMSVLRQSYQETYDKSNEDERTLLALEIARYGGSIKNNQVEFDEDTYKRWIEEAKDPLNSYVRDLSTTELSEYLGELAVSPDIISTWGSYTNTVRQQLSSASPALIKYISLIKDATASVDELKEAQHNLAVEIATNYIKGLEESGKVTKGLSDTVASMLSNNKTESNKTYNKKEEDSRTFGEAWQLYMKAMNGGTLTKEEWEKVGSVVGKTDMSDYYDGTLDIRTDTQMQGQMTEAKAEFIRNANSELQATRKDLITKNQTKHVMKTTISNQAVTANGESISFVDESDTSPEKQDIRMILTKQGREKVDEEMTKNVAMYERMGYVFKKDENGEYVKDNDGNYIIEDYNAPKVYTATSKKDWAAMASTRKTEIENTGEISRDRYVRANALINSPENKRNLKSAQDIAELLFEAGLVDEANAMLANEEIMRLGSSSPASLDAAMRFYYNGAYGNSGGYYKDYSYNNNLTSKAFTNAIAKGNTAKVAYILNHTFKTDEERQAYVAEAKQVLGSENVDDVLHAAETGGKVSEGTISRMQRAISKNPFLEEIQSADRFGESTENVINIISKLIGTAQEAASAIDEMNNAFKQASQNAFYRTLWDMGNKSDSTIEAISSATGLTARQITNADNKSLVDYRLGVTESADIERAQEQIDAVVAKAKNEGENGVYVPATGEWTSTSGSERDMALKSLAAQGFTYTVDKDTGDITITGIGINSSALDNPLKNYGINYTSTALNEAAKVYYNKGTNDEDSLDDMFYITNTKGEKVLNQDLLNQIKDKYPDLYRYLNMTDAEKNSDEGLALKQNLELSFKVNGLSDLKQAGKILQQTQEWIAAINTGGLKIFDFTKSFREEVEDKRDFVKAISKNKRSYDDDRAIMQTLGISEEKFYGDETVYLKEANDYLDAYLNVLSTSMTETYEKAETEDQKLLVRKAIESYGGTVEEDGTVTISKDEFKKIMKEESNPLNSYNRPLESTELSSYLVELASSKDILETWNSFDNETQTQLKDASSALMNYLSLIKEGKIDTEAFAKAQKDLAIEVATSYVKSLEEAGKVTEGLSNTVEGLLSGNSVKTNKTMNTIGNDVTEFTRQWQLYQKALNGGKLTKEEWDSLGSLFGIDNMTQFYNGEKNISSLKGQAENLRDQQIKNANAMISGVLKSNIENAKLYQTRWEDSQSQDERNKIVEEYNNKYGEGNITFGQPDRGFNKVQFKSVGINSSEYKNLVAYYKSLGLEYDENKHEFTDFNPKNAITAVDAESWLSIYRGSVLADKNIGAVKASRYMEAYDSFANGNKTYDLSNEEGFSNWLYAAGYGDIADEILNDELLKGGYSYDKAKEVLRKRGYDNLGMYQMSYKYGRNDIVTSIINDLLSGNTTELQKLFATNEQGEYIHGEDERNSILSSVKQYLTEDAYDKLLNGTENEKAAALKLARENMYKEKFGEDYYGDKNAQNAISMYESFIGTEQQRQKSIQDLYNQVQTKQTGLQALSLAANGDYSDAVLSAIASATGANAEDIKKDFKADPKMAEKKYKELMDLMMSDTVDALAKNIKAITGKDLSSLKGMDTNAIISELSNVVDDTNSWILDVIKTLGATITEQGELILNNVDSKDIYKSAEETTEEKIKERQVQIDTLNKAKEAVENQKKGLKIHKKTEKKDLPRWVNDGMFVFSETAPAGEGWVMDGTYGSVGKNVVIDPITAFMEEAGKGNQDLVNISPMAAYAMHSMNKGENKFSYDQILQWLNQSIQGDGSYTAKQNKLLLQEFFGKDFSKMTDINEWNNFNNADNQPFSEALVKQYSILTDIGTLISENKIDEAKKAIEELNKQISVDGVSALTKYSESADDINSFLKEFSKGAQSAGSAASKFKNSLNALGANYKKIQEILKGKKAGKDLTKEEIEALKATTGYDEDVLNEMTSEEIKKTITEKAITNIQTEAITYGEELIAATNYTLSNLPQDEAFELNKQIRIVFDVESGEADIQNALAAIKSINEPLYELFMSYVGSGITLQAEEFAYDDVMGYLWKLINADISGAKGGKKSSGGGGKSKIDKLLEKQKRKKALYDHLIKMVQYQETKYQNAGELTNYGLMIEKENEIRATRAPQIHEDIEEIRSLMKTTEAESDDWYKLRDAIMALEEEEQENNNAIANNTKKLKENKEEIRKVTTALKDAIRQIAENEETERRNELSATVELQNTILDAIKQRYQDEWDLIKEDLNRKKMALQEEMSMIDERLNKRKEAADESEKFDELIELRRQYALISTNEARSKDAAEVAEKIKDLEKELAWNIAEDEAEAQKKALQDESNSIDNYMSQGDEYMQNFLEDANNFADEVAQVLGLSQEDLLAWLMENNKEYIHSLEEAQRQMLDNWTDTYNKMMAIVIRYNELINTLLNGTKEEYLTYMKEHYTDGNGKFWDDLTYEEQGSQLYEWEDLWDKNYSAYLNYATWDHSDDFESGKSSSKGNNKDKDSIKEAINESKVTEILEDTKKSIMNMLTLGLTKGLGEKDNSGSILGDAVADITNNVKDKAKVPANAEGGLVDYTGLAWVDGTYSNPEAFLSAEDTRLIRNMIDTYKYIKAPSSIFVDQNKLSGNNMNIGEVTITLNEAQFNTDDDYDLIAQKVGESFTKELSKQGFSTVNLNF